MIKKTVTGRTPSQPELPCLPEQPGDMLRCLKDKNPDIYAELEKNNALRVAVVDASAEQFFIDVLTGKRPPAAKGLWRAAGGQMQNIPRSVLIEMPYSETEQRVTAMHPALGAPYGQEEKTND